MKKTSAFTGLLPVFLLALLCASCASSDGAALTDVDAERQSAPSNPYFTGDGGKGLSIAIIAPRATGLADNQDYLPALAQGGFVSAFTGYSAISVLDRERLDEQYAELLSGYYADDAEAGLDLGRLPPTDYIMSGNITKTATGYALQIGITKTTGKMTVASHTGTCTFLELDNLTGVRRASLDLLQQMGVTPTERPGRKPSPPRPRTPGAIPPTKAEGQPKPPSITPRPRR
jgi:hypothetical protein